MNAARTGRRVWPLVAAAAIGIAVLAVVMLGAGYLFLPELITDRLPRESIRRLGVSDFSGRITAVGPYRTSAGPFVFGDFHRPALAVHTVEIDYTPSGLIRRTIERVRIRDVVVNATLGPDGLSLPGLDTAAMTAADPTGAAAQGRPLDLTSLNVKRIDIRGGLLHLRQGDSLFKIPFDADLTPQGAGLEDLSARLRLFPRDQRVSVAIRARLDARRVRIEVNAPRLRLDAFADLIRRLAGLDAAGAVAVHGTAEWDWAPGRLVDGRLRLVWHDGRVAGGPLRLAAGTGGSPTVVTAVYTEPGTWRIDGGGLKFQEPLPLDLETLTATLRVDQGSTTLSGAAGVKVLPVAVDAPLPVSLKSPTDLRLAFQAASSTADGWSAVLETARDGTPGAVRSSKLTMGVAGAAVLTHAPRLQLTASGRGGDGRVRLELALDSARIDTPSATLTLPPAAADGDVRFRPGSRRPAVAGEARIRFPGLTAVGYGLAGHLETVTLSARFQRSEDADLSVAGRLGCTGGRLEHAASGIRLSGVRLDLPWGTADATEGGDGTFAVDRVAWGDRELGEVSVSVGRQPEVYAVGGAFVRRLVPSLRAEINGRVATTVDRVGHAVFRLNLPETRLPAGTDLGRFFPAGGGVTLSGTVSARAEADVSPAGLAGSLEVAMAGGEVALADKQVSVTGLEAALRFPELPRLRSAPAQPIRFSGAAVGGIAVDGGSFDVQVEAADTLLVEKGRLAWCGGKVDVQSLRVTTGRSDYTVSLYCQRLGLSRILEQLGAVHATGSGTVNGRIPIAYSGGKIRFDDGFLFSTPGEGGTIQVTGTDILTRGIPAGTPQFAQLDLAREALKDYAYEWVKLGLVSEGEDFVLRLQFDGKPVNPLPFVYNQEIGGFARVTAGGQGSVFQGIALDVNLRLPLNRLLQYKDIVNMIH